MAFSTQKDFLKIGFLNDCNDLNTESRRRHQVSLKTYTSCTDSRAWSLSQEKQAKYLTDIVACGTRFVEDGDGFESGDSENNLSGDMNSAPGPSRGINRPGASRPGSSRPDTARAITGAGGSGPGDRRPGSSSGQGTVTGQGAETGNGGGFDTTSYISSAYGGPGNFTSGDQGNGGGICADDSLIEAACMKLDEINAIVRENSELKKKLELSEDKLDRLDNENNKIKAIITDSTAGSFGPVEDEIKVLKAKGELNTDNVLKLLKKYIEDSKVQNRKCDMMLVENESLKSRIEKLEARVKISVVPAKKETSADVNYLQSTVNDLRNEMLQLRAIEEDRAKVKVEFDNLKQQIKHIGSPDDLYNMKKASVAIREVKCDRDRLRDLINSMVGIEDDLKKIKERAEKSDKLEKQVAELSIRLENASSNQMAGGLRCDEMKSEIDKLKKEKAEAQLKLKHMTSEDSDFSQAQEKLKEFDRVSCELHLYKIHYSELCNELRRVSYNFFQLETELEATKQKLCCADYSISSYEKQMDDLMEIIRELESERKKCPQQFEQAGGTSQDAHIQDLLAITKVTTIYIQKETEARKKLEEELKKCKAELGRLSKANVGGSREKFEDLQAKLKTCETEIGRLKKKNEALLGQISNEDVEDLLDQLNACKRENEKLQNQVSNAGDKQQFDSVFGELNSCKELLNASKGEKDKLNDRIANLQKELDECRKNNSAAALLEEKEDALKDCQDKVKDLENQLRKITEELEESANNCAEQLKQLKEHFEKEKTDLQEKLDDELHFQNTSSTNLTSDLSNCRDELQKLRDQLKEEADKCQAEKEQLQQQVIQLNEAQKNLGQAGNTISEDIKNLEKKLADCQRENEALQKERDSLTNELNECKAGNDNELSRLRNERDEQIKASKACEDEKNSLANQLLSANNDLSQLKSQLVQQKGQGDEDCERVKAALKDNQDKYSQLESRYDSLQQHDASIQKALDELRKEYEVKTLEWTKELNEQKSLLAQAKASLEAQRGEIFRLNELLIQNSCKDLEDKLASMLAENNHLKAENDKAKQSLKSKEDEISSLQQRVDSINSQLAKCEEAIKSTDCSKYINEIESLKNAIAIHLDEIKQQAALLESVKREIEAAKANNASLQSEIDEIKVEKEAANQALKAKEAEMNKIRNDFANASQPQDNDQLRKCLEEQQRLEDENKRLQEEFKQLENLVKDIEEERKKNTQLESLIEELEQRIKDLQSHQTTVVPGADINVQSIIDKLKDQLQMETNKNNALTTELQTCKSSLGNLQEKLKELAICRDQLQTTQSQLKEKEAEVENLKREIESTKLTATVKPVASVGPSVRPVPSVDPTSKPVASSESIVKVQQVTESVVLGSAQSFVGPPVIAVGSGHGNMNPNLMLASTISEIQNSHCANLEKMQKMYEERMREMMINHDKEIQSLRMTNEALRKTLVDIKAQIAALGGIGDIGKLNQINKELEELKLGVCKCNQESDINVCGQDTKLNKICTKILKTSIDCLSLRELKYLHCAVYRAGCKMKPMITADANEIGRCCQCTGFVCSLPSIPKESEKKFIERINCLENELENANDVLQRLRERYESKANCSRRCCAGQTERRAPPRGINDAVNQILKCAREGRRNSGC